MAFIFQVASSKSKLYSVDEFGVINYKTRFVAMLCILSMATLILLFGGITYYAEFGTEGATIQSFGDALWLMVMSSTTIGFGSQYPVTVIGRVMVTMMFISGVGIIGGLGALVASKLLGFSDTNVKNRELRKQNAEILAMNKKLEQKLDLLVEKIEPMVSNNKND
ncbi:potassium channel family protein [Thalassotalea sp. 1_MG-2023]|uniref:potassium channel family protein n=1 Tax=Thalassotalea sp. 1_MG-2023 TaxID=3062680 RepID=UPI0026E3FBDF|nr:potassium channel family protein [Thalassotalea sp. 1_MG-2023]MDO6428073.1 potassium channel family protein [Thalassotalea sp. 1_MG-2023]